MKIITPHHAYFITHTVFYASALEDHIYGAKSSTGMGVEYNNYLNVELNPWNHLSVSKIYSLLLHNILGNIELW